MSNSNNWLSALKIIQRHLEFYGIATEMNQIVVQTEI